jgi:hypothetical protein
MHPLGDAPQVARCNKQVATVAEPRDQVYSAHPQLLHQFRPDLVFDASLTNLLAGSALSFQDEVSVCSEHYSKPSGWCGMSLK